MKAASKWTLTGALGLIATVVGIWSTGVWDHVGWTTPNAHAADVQKIQDERILTAGQLKDFRDEWKCDEYDEELLELRRRLVAAETEDEKVTLRHQIAKLEKKMEANECSRFEDFG